MAEFTNIVLFFSLYSFLGWMLEVTYSSISAGKLANRGYLYGPFCPIYGVGAIIILYISKIINNLFPSESWVSIAIILMLSIILVTLWEYIVALIQEKVCGTKLWDYSKEAFNLHGRICLKYSLLWGCLAFLVITVIHPFMEFYVLQLQFYIKATITFLFIIYLSVDSYLSLRKHCRLAQNCE